MTVNETEICYFLLPASKRNTKIKWQKLLIATYCTTSRPIFIPWRFLYERLAPGEERGQNVLWLYRTMWGFTTFSQSQSRSQSFHSVPQPQVESFLPPATEDQTSLLDTMNAGPPGIRTPLCPDPRGGSAHRVRCGWKICQNAEDRVD